MSIDRSPNCSRTAADDLGLSDYFIDPDPTYPVHRLDSTRMTGAQS